MWNTKEQLNSTGAGIIRPRPRGTGDAPIDYSGMTAPPNFIVRGRFWHYPQPRVQPSPTVSPINGQPAAHPRVRTVPA